MLDDNNKPIPGLSLPDCMALKADAMKQIVSWNSVTDLGQLAGKPMRLRIELKNADLFSFQFTGKCMHKMRLPAPCGTE